jgi:DNA mismatch repair protein MutS2
MTFRIGDRVHVATLGKGIVRAVRNAGRYLVEVKGRAILVPGSELGAIDSPMPSRRASRSGDRASSPSADALSTRPRGPSSLDLHGKTVHEAIEALDTFLNESLLGGHVEVRVIHGRSGGRLKAAVHAHLKEVASVRGFRLDSQNEGVTIVTC